MAANRNAKSELIAIYRLEFYKKQKNWKLSTDKQKKSVEDSKHQKPNLNVTYDVDRPSRDIEDINECLNKAFVDSNSGKITKSPAKQTRPRSAIEKSRKTDKKTKLDINKTQTVNPKIPVKENFLKTAKNYPILDRGLRDQCEEWPDQAWHDQNSNIQWLAQESQGLSNQEWSELGSVQTWPGAKVGCFEAAVHGGGWSPQSQIWSDGLDLNDGDLELVCVGEELVEDTWIPHHDWNEDEDLWLPPVNLVEFMRGAHEAPHSSEVDLRPDLSLEDHDDDAGLEGLSSSQLVARVRRHAHALRYLLCEASARCPTKLSDSLPPVGRVVPAHSSPPLRREATFSLSHDRVLAGSRDSRGRGRGRLRGIL